MSNSCAVCGVAADLKCGGCKLVHYCGRDHQRQHWKAGHKTGCKCYKVGTTTDCSAGYVNVSSTQSHQKHMLLPSGWQVITNSQLGRHVVATRNVKRGEVILQERPLVRGPKLVSEPMCLGCSVKLTLPAEFAPFYQCSGCRWPLCGPKCEKSPVHRAECALIGQAGRICPIEGLQVSSGYSVIVPLRCLLLQKTDPKG